MEGYQRDEHKWGGEKGVLLGMRALTPPLFQPTRTIPLDHSNRMEQSGSECQEEHHAEPRSAPAHKQRKDGREDADRDQERLRQWRSGWGQFVDPPLRAFRRGLPTDRDASSVADQPPAGCPGTERLDLIAAIFDGLAHAAAPSTPHLIEPRGCQLFVDPGSCRGPRQVAIEGCPAHSDGRRCLSD